MIGKLVGLLVGRKVKEQIVDTVLDKVNLPDPVEGAIKIAATGNMGGLLGNVGKDMATEAAIEALTKKGKKK